MEKNRIIFNPIKLLVIYFVRFYQIFISPILGNNCRFYPTCSEYCIESLRELGLVKGLYFFGKRLIKCHPFGGGGFDPVKSSKETKFRQISGKKIRNFRKKNLYIGLPTKLSHYKGDFLASTKHFCLFEKNQIISCLTIIDSDFFGSKKCIQIRGMFTKREFLRQGYGKILMRSLLKYLKNKKKYEIVWCNSRKSAIDFYTRLGFKEKGKFFIIKHIGLHKKLFRKI